MRDNGFCVEVEVEGAGMFVATCQISLWLKAIKSKRDLLDGCDWLEGSYRSANKRALISGIKCDKTAD